VNLGRAEGFQQGIDHGKAEGKAEGFMDGMKAMARKMLELGEPLEKVVSLTGLSEEEILRLV
jgi:predicted transposase/invertase (TIGR01784 family)